MSNKAVNFLIHRKASLAIRKAINETRKQEFLSFLTNQGILSSSFSVAYLDLEKGCWRSLLVCDKKNVYARVNDNDLNKYSMILPSINTKSTDIVDSRFDRVREETYQNWHYIDDTIVYCRRLLNSQPILLKFGYIKE